MKTKSVLIIAISIMTLIVGCSPAKNKEIENLRRELFKRDEDIRELREALLESRLKEQQLYKEREEREIEKGGEEELGKINMD
jgi:hypothetical protein